MIKSSVIQNVCRVLLEGSDGVKMWKEEVVVYLRN